MVDAEVFDVGAYTRASFGPARTGLPKSVIEPGLAEAISYVQHRIGDTSTWLSHVLVTATHKDARITAFLSTWAYEQIWLAESLGELVGDTAATSQAYGQREGNRWGPLHEALLSNVYGHALTGVHMSERLVDSLLLDAMLERIEARVPDEARSIVTHVRQTLARQRTFFLETTLRELSSSLGSRMLSHRRLKRHVFPLGADRVTWLKSAVAFRTLFGDDVTWARHIDAQVDKLPGLHGLRLAVKTVKRFKLF